MHVNMRLLAWSSLESTYGRCDVRRAHVADILDAALCAPRPRLLLDDTHDGRLGGLALALALGAEVKAVGGRRSAVESAQQQAWLWLYSAAQTMQLGRYVACGLWPVALQRAGGRSTGGAQFTRRGAQGVEMGARRARWCGRQDTRSTDPRSRLPRVASKRETQTGGRARSEVHSLGISTVTRHSSSPYT
jgi:hypothetical protein